MNIKEFNLGEKIVRVEPSEGIGDRSYIGDALILKGIANGCCYFERVETCGVLGKDLKLKLDWFSNGWERFQEISEIGLDTKSKVKYNFKKEIHEAVKNEDYELLAELKKIFDKVTLN